MLILDREIFLGTDEVTGEEKGKTADGFPTREGAAISFRWELSKGSPNVRLP